MRIFRWSPVLMLWVLPTVASAQSDFALRFFGTGVGPPGQEDRILLPVDDNAPGDSSTPIDVGAGSFTLELWLRGRLADNATSHSGGDVEVFDYSWIEGNIILDRDVWCGTANAFGVSLAGGKVRFGVDSGDVNPSSVNTIEGSEDVLDDAWHHVAVVRDVLAGDLRIVVDGVEDFRSSPGVSTTDLSYPDGGIPVTGNCDTGQLTAYGWYLVVAAEKHDAGAAYPSFNGYVDELRIWSTARTNAEIAAHRFQILSPGTVGLVGSYRFEEGAGVTVSDSSGSGSPDGELRSGVSGNGEWVSRADNAANTAPIGGLVFEDGFESGDTSAWSFEPLLAQAIMSGPGYSPSFVSAVMSVMPSLIACAKRIRSNGSLCNAGKPATLIACKLLIANSM